VAFKKFTTYRQLDAMDCGPTCLKIVFKHYGKQINLEGIKRAAQIGSTGVSLLGMAEAAEKYGFRTLSARISFEQLLEDAPLPCILHWNQYHFVVLTPDANAKKLTIADPARGLITLTKADFIKNWISVTKEGEPKGIVLLLTPRANFYQQEDDRDKEISWGLLSNYALQYKKQIFQLFIGLLLGSLLQLIFPYLTQSIVDTGINTQNLQFIEIILIAQLLCSLGKR